MGLGIRLLLARHVSLEVRQLGNPLLPFLLIPTEEATQLLGELVLGDGTGSALDHGE